MKIRTLFIVTLVVLFALPLFAKNLVVGGSMESETGWNITDYANNGSTDYEFGFTADSLAFGYGGCLHIYQGEDQGQFLLWQRVKVIAGQKYRVAGAIKLVDYNPGTGDGGTWYQMYTSQEEVDEGAGEYNPVDDKILDVGEGWARESGFFDGVWESINLSQSIPTVPYYIPEGTPGEEVEITFAIKFGQYWPDYSGAFFEILVDEVGLYPLEDAVNANGDMESEGDWYITDYANNGSIEYEFGFTTEVPSFGHGACLHIYQGEAQGQFLLWQRVNVIAGQKYRVTGAVKLLDWNPGTGDGGTWYQMYTSPEEVDEGAGEYNPVDHKIFDLGDGWGRESGVFDDLWEVVNVSQAIPTVPYYIPEGTPGEEVEITFGIKFGQYWPDYTGTFFELLVDEVYLLSIEEEGGTAVNFEADPVTPVEFALEQNYPNPFNPTTTISFNLPETANTTLKVYNTLGAEVATLVDGQMQAGAHQVSLSVQNLSSGIYYYTLQQNNFTATKKCVVLK